MKIEYSGKVGISLDTSRIDGNIAQAQMRLNEKVVADCDPFIPFQQGGLRGSLRYPLGIYGGEIEWNAPYAHYQFAGEVYGPNIPLRDSEGNITGWYSPPQKAPTGRRLQYHTPGTGADWFGQAKAQHLNDWIKIVKDTIGQ